MTFIEKIPGYSNERLLTLIILLLHASISSCQISIEGAHLMIESNAVLVLEGDCKIINGGVFDNSGHIEIYGDLEDDLSSDFLSADESSVRFLGQNDSYVSLSSDSLYLVEIDKTMDHHVILESHLVIRDSLKFLSQANKVILGNNDLEFSKTNAVVNYDSTNYLVAHEVGKVIYNLSTWSELIFPVGDSSQYSPMNVKSPTGDLVDSSQIKINLKRSKHPDLEPIKSDYLNRYWQVNTFHINNFHAIAEATYVPSDITGLESKIQGQTFASPRGWLYEHHSINQVDKTVEVTIRATEEDVTGANILGSIDLTLFLQGPYSTSGDTMKTDLNKDTTGGTVNILESFALKCPYDTNVTVNSGFFLSHPAIIDWIMLESREPHDSSIVIDTVFGFLTSEGKMLSLDGLPNLQWLNAKDSSWLVVKHRNHLGICTPSVTYLDSLGHYQNNFSTSLSQVWQDPAVSHDPMTELKAGVFGMIRGDANGNGKNNVADVIKAKLASEPNQSDIYLLEDVNLNGKTNVGDLVQAKLSSSPNQLEHVPK